MRLIAISVLITALFGCASEPELYAPDDGRAATDIEFQRALAGCRAQSSMLPVQTTRNQRNALDTGGAMMDFGASLQGYAMGMAYLENCLRANGWVKASKAPPRPIETPNPARDKQSSRPFPSLRFQNEGAPGDVLPETR